MDTILLQANNLAFARKFDGDVTSPVRLYALEIAAGKYYEELRQKHITEDMLRWVDDTIIAGNVFEMRINILRGIAYSA